MTDERTFDDADWYDCDDRAEELTHEYWPDAIDAYLQARTDEPGVAALRAVIKDCAPLTVYAFHREELEPRWLAGLAADLADKVVEEWIDNYGDPEHGVAFDQNALSKAFADALFATVKPDHVWRCEQRGEREYSEADLLEMFKDELKDLEA